MFLGVCLKACLGWETPFHGRWWPWAGGHSSSPRGPITGLVSVLVTRQLASPTESEPGQTGGRKRSTLPDSATLSFLPSPVGHTSEPSSRRVAQPALSKEQALVRDPPSLVIPGV